MSNQEPDQQKSSPKDSLTSGEVEYGGEVESSAVPPPIAGDPYDPREPERRGKLAFGLVCVLGGLIFGHYIFIAILDWNGKSGAVKTLESTFNATLPVVSGLVSSAVTYYFTKNKS